LSKSVLVCQYYGYQLTTTKESNIRDVDVAPEFMAFLKDYHEQWKSRKKLMGASWQKNLEKKGSKYAQSLLDLRGNDFVICNDYGFPINPDSYGALVRRVGKKAGIESCDVVCAVTDDDNTNIMVSQLAKEVYGVKKVVSRILDPERGDIFAHFGLETVCPTKLTVEAICSAIKPMLEEKYVSFGSHMVRFTTMEIPKEFIGMTPVDIEYEENETLYAIIRADSTIEIVNNYNVVMREGDKLIFSKAI